MTTLARLWRLFSEYLRARWRFRRLRGDALVAWQSKRATDVARFAQNNSAFYRRLTAGIPPEEWRRFPVIDKAIMMANFDELNTRGVTARAALEVALRAEESRDFTETVGGLSVVLSSGTSGNRTISLVDDHEGTGFVGFMLARMLEGARLRKNRVAFFLRSNSNVYEASRNPFVDFRYFDLSLTREQICERLGSFQPHILMGPPALLCVVAELVDEGRLSIAPEMVISGAEVLEPQDRERLERVFGVIVREVYHTSEGPIGVSCARGRMHIPEDVSFVELEPLGDGRYTPIVTQLFRRIQPLLRYRMNDIVTLDDTPCPCGSAFRVLATVEGRCDDILYLRRTDGRLKHVFPDQLRRAALETDGIREYRVEQLAFDHLRFYVDRSTRDDAALTATVHTRMGVDGCVAPRIEILDGIPVEADRRRKLVRVRRLFKLATEELELVV